MNMRYKGPIYRPPSESGSLLVQATVGCPHNKCTFCMVYKKGPAYEIRPVREIIEDLDEALRLYGPDVPTLFFPAGNTIAMPTPDLAAICSHARGIFTGLKRITVYGSSMYIDRKSREDLEMLAKSGLTRIHVGFESGDDVVLARTKKGADARTQVRALKTAMEAGLEISVYVVLGLGGKERTLEHARATTEVLNRIRPPFVRIRTFLPKINTLMLHQIRKGQIKVVSPHEALTEARIIAAGLDFPCELVSDHYTNYLNITGRLPEDREKLLELIDFGLKRPESDFREVYVGHQ